MRKVLKWIGIVLGGLIVVIVVAVLGLSIAGNAKLHKTIEVPDDAITIPTDEASLARGKQIVTGVCSGCHGENLAGMAMIDDPSIGTIYAANLTVLSTTWSDADYVRAIRHAVAPDGRELPIMPAEAWIHLSAEDLGSIVAYLKTLTPSGEASPEPNLTLMGRVLLATGQFGQIFPAEYIDHSTPFPAMPAIGANVAYGEYIAEFCKSCHGENLNGMQPQGDPTSPPAPNLTPGGELVGWTEDGFVQTFRTGVTPAGRELNNEYMPWKEFGSFSDDELKGVWMYLQSLPAMPSGNDNPS
jgi:mono/diheme cytochrome c family protein